MSTWKFLPLSHTSEATDKIPRPLSVSILTSPEGLYGLWWQPSVPDVRETLQDIPGLALRSAVRKRMGQRRRGGVGAAVRN